MTKSNKIIYFSGEDSWDYSDEIVKELLSFLYDNNYLEYAKKYLDKDEYNSLLDYDIHDSGCMRWGEDWEHPFHDLYKMNIFITNDNNETICENSHALMKFLVDNFVNEIKEQEKWTKGKILVESGIEVQYSVLLTLLSYLLNNGLHERLVEVLGDASKIDVLFESISDDDSYLDSIPGFWYDQRFEGGPMSESYVYDAYFEEAELENAIKYILNLAKEYGSS